MLDSDKASLFAADWIAAWNAHDLERVLAHYSDDVTLVSPYAVALAAARDRTVRGLPALRRYFERGLDASPDLHFELIAALPGVRSVALLYRAVGGRTGIEVCELDPAGRVVRAAAHYGPADLGSPA